VNTCDDCRVDYPGEPYYTFDADGCTYFEMVDGVSTLADHDCTENICPTCTGPFLEPDDEMDPRKPSVDFYDERLHESLEVQAKVGMI
jgi:hypothetical protein